VAALTQGEVFDVEAFGVFDPAHVAVRFDDAPPLALPPALEALIAEAWAAKEATSRRSGALLFNGRIVKLLGSRVRDGVLHLRTGPTDYRTFVGTNLANPHRIAELGRDCFANPIGTTATIISNDGYLLYGRRSQQVAYHQGYLHTFGGGLEEREVGPDRTIDVFASVLRELDEELHVAAYEVARMICVGLIRDREIHQPELLFDADVALSRDALLARLNLDDPHQEHTAVESVPDQPDALIPFIRSAGLIAPVAVGAILLHGRRRWGDRWYTNARRDLFGKP
jgi:hypothetical protein